MGGYKSLYYILMALAYAGSGCAQRPERSVSNTPGRTTVSPSYGLSEPAVDNIDGPSLGHEDMVTFTSSASIEKGETLGIVLVKGPDTVLTVSGGSINELIVKDNGCVSVDSGIIKEMTLYDKCEAQVLGGKIGTMSGYGENTVTIKDKAKIENLNAYGSTQVIVDSNDASIGTIQYFTKCGCVNQSQKVKLELSGSQFDHIGTGLSEVALNIMGTHLTKSAYGGDYGYGEVTGRWRDGTGFSISFMDKWTFAHTDLHSPSSASNQEAHPKPGNI